MRTLILSLCGLCLTLAAVAAEAPRVALLHGSYGNFRHRDDYDGVMRDLGWKLEKVENKDFAALAGRLGQYDLVLGTALFNYSVNVQDFSVYREQLLAFVRNGGAVLLTDCNYPDHVNWLSKWGPDWAVGTKPCATTVTPTQWLDVTHPVFSGAAPIRQLGASWSQMTPGAGWQVLAKCTEGGATALFRSEGRGYFLLTNFWPYSAPQLRNLWATLQYTRAGFLPTLPDLTALTYGDNKLTGSFRNLSAEALNLTARLGVQDPAGGNPQCRAEATAAPGGTGQWTLQVPLTQRGSYELYLNLQGPGGAEFAAGQCALKIPDLIELQVLEPRYRGAVMLAAPPKRLRARVTLHPFTENLEGLPQVTRLWRGGKVVAENPRPWCGREFDVTVPWKDAVTGRATLEVSLLKAPGGPAVHSVRQEIPVVPARTPQVFIDEDLNTRVDGKLFFPITVYHVPVADFAKVKALGFNSLQAWGNNPPQARENLEAARKQGLKVILEGATHAAGEPEKLAPMLAEFEKHPALLSWYLTDEPSGDERFAWCQRFSQYLRKNALHHPVFMTSCSPGEFARYAPVTDIFAVDPYPIPAAPVTMVSVWMKTAMQAAAGRQPVWLIPQLHNWAAYDGHPENGRYPTPAEERNMVYQGLVWGAKGIFYYPWDDGCTGLVKDPGLMAAVGKINAELAELGPELLACRRKLTADNTGPNAGLYAAVYRGAKANYVIAVSVLTEARELAVPTGLKAGPAPVMFEQRSATVGSEGAIKDKFEPLEVHVYRVAATK